MVANLAINEDSRLTADEVSRILSQLSPMAEGLYYFLPEECWMTEQTMAKALKTHTRVIRDAKQELEAAGLIYIIHENNKDNRPNPLHRIIKVEYTGMLPILEEYLWIEGARERVLTPQLQEYQVIDSKNILPAKSEIAPLPKTFEVSMNWELLKEYSAAEINRMTKLEQVELYMEVGFLVLPTHYPIFRQSGQVSCSCKQEYCHAIGKHPAVKKFKSLTPESYQKKRKYYMQRFKNNPNLNIGFKPYGFSVVDVDFSHGGGFSLELLREEANGLDETLTVTSANGVHLYSSTVGLNQSVSSLGEGLDIRSDKTTGFIVAPCSIHKSGKRYQWLAINDLQPIPDEWLNENHKLEEKSNKPESIRRNTGQRLKDINIPNRIPDRYLIKEGERAVTLFKFACRERGRGADEKHIYDVLVNLRDKYCERSKDPNNDITNAELRYMARDVVRRYPTNAEKSIKTKVA
jgi:hypothetical protein